MKPKERADLLLVRRGLVPSRHKGEGLILAGRVLADGRPVRKSGELFPERVALEIVPGKKFVSRGGIKLDHALTRFGMEVKGGVALDAGASTGGFTDCLLQRGVRRAHAVDVGHGQFDSSLKKDERVRLYEKTNVRYLTPDLLGEKVDLIVADLSFISLTKVLPALRSCLKEGGEMVLLVKPQFELTPKEVGKGVVRDPELRRKAVLQVKEKMVGWGLRVTAETPSPILGPKGNEEFFLRVKKI